MTNVWKERIPLLRITVREIDLAKCLTLSVNMGGGGGGDAKYPFVCIKAKLSGRGVHNVTVRELWQGYESEKTL